MRAGGRAPYRWELVQAPDWLVIGMHGAIAGTPDKAGSFRLAIALTDQYDDRTTTDAYLIVKAKPTITTTRLAPARVGRSYRAPLHSNGGVTPFHWKVTSGRFPVGIRLNTSTGAPDRQAPDSWHLCAQTDSQRRARHSRLNKAHPHRRPRPPPTCDRPRLVTLPNRSHPAVETRIRPGTSNDSSGRVVNGPGRGAWVVAARRGSVSAGSCMLCARAGYLGCHSRSGGGRRWR